jgi:3D (Asp-Asp-Asp) domain-containing protein
VIKLYLSEIKVVAVTLVICFSLVSDNLGNATTTRTKTKSTIKSVIKSKKQPRRRWDSSLVAHPSRGSYRRRLPVRATAYMPIDDPIEGGRWTKTERDGRSVHGVAVDPRVIPLGTRLWIPGYGHAIADDIGSAIKGHRIDLRMQQAANMHRWGVRQVHVYVLK